MLNDRQIERALKRGQIKIDPAPAAGAIQPASVDLTLGGTFVTFQDRGRTILMEGAGWRDRPPTTYHHSGTFQIEPGQFVLATTVEEIWLPDNIVGRIEGKSSLGRVGLMVHVTAGFVDPGFHGTVTLEMVNVSPVSIEMRMGTPICQISFDKVRKVKSPYGSKARTSSYQGQKGVRLSKYHTPPEEEEV